jgi:hypothetical protein
MKIKFQILKIALCMILPAAIYAQEEDIVSLACGREETTTLDPAYYETDEVHGSSKQACIDNCAVALQAKLDIQMNNFTCATCSSGCQKSFRMNGSYTVVMTVDPYFGIEGWYCKCKGSGTFWYYQTCAACNEINCSSH